MSEHLLTEKRFIDLSNLAERKGIVTFSDFLTINELNIFHQNARNYVTSYEISGGYEFAERQIAAFIPDALYYIWEYPIDCLLIKPSYPKFAEQLSHRDILGAVMNLGIERSKIGDILVENPPHQGTICYMFCKQEITSYICTELHQIRHTIVECTIQEQHELAITPNFEAHNAIIASNRLDNVVSALCKSSRTTAVNDIHSGKIMINGKECLHNTYICKPNDVLSIRSHGKFIFEGEDGVTKKNRVKINYKKYI